MKAKIACFVAFAAVVVGANALTATLGIVTWLGLTATAGTWLAGLALVARDELQETAGLGWVFVAIGTGALLSAILSPRLALASAVAFAVAELTDLGVYTPLRKRSKIGAAIASNTAGAAADTVLFLAIAGFPLTATLTQMIIKVGMSTIAAFSSKGIHALLRKSVRQ